MKSRLSDSAGYKTTAVALGDIEHRVTIRRLPMRPLDNDSRYRVRVVTRTLAGVVLTDRHRDMPISKAYRVYEQNVNRLHKLISN